MTIGHESRIGLGSLEVFEFYWVITLSKQIGLDPENFRINANIFKRLPQYLKFEGGPILYLCVYLARIFNLIFV
jgi:hypothetical protein